MNIMNNINNINNKKKIQVLPQYNCNLCNNTYATNSSLSHHKQICKGNSLKLKYDLMKKELEQITQKNLEANIEINLLKTKVDKIYKINNQVNLNKENLNNINQANLNLNQVNLNNINQANLNLNKENLNNINQANLNLNKENLNNLNKIKIFRCTYCNSNNFSYQQSLSRHMKVCTQQFDSNNKIIDLQKQINDLKLDKEKIFSLASTNSHIINSSISAIKHLTMYHKNAPALRQIVDFTTFHIEYPDNTSFIKAVVQQQRDKTLDVFIGEYLVKIYKTDDPFQQSIWTTDAVRFSYLIRELMKDGSLEWITDKNGVVATKTVVKPILAYLKKLIKQFIKECHKECTQENKTLEKQTELIAYQRDCNLILTNITNRSIEKDVKKYVSIALFLDKQKALEELNLSIKLNLNNQLLLEQDNKNKLIKNSKITIKEVPNDYVSDDEHKKTKPKVINLNLNKLSNKEIQLKAFENKVEKEKEKEVEVEDEVDSKKIIVKSNIVSCKKPKYMYASSDEDEVKVKEVKVKKIKIKEEKIKEKEIKDYDSEDEYPDEIIKSESSNGDMTEHNNKVNQIKLLPAKLKIKRKITDSNYNPYDTVSESDHSSS
jgi:hypothetical protein